MVLVSKLAPIGLVVQIYKLLVLVAGNKKAKSATIAANQAVLRLITSRSTLGSRKSGTSSTSSTSKIALVTSNLAITSLEEEEEVMLLQWLSISAI